MATLREAYTLADRNVSTSIDPSYGSTLLGAPEGLAARAAQAAATLSRVVVMPDLIDVTYSGDNGGGHLFLSGSFSGSLDTTSFMTFFSNITGTVNQIAEVEMASPASPRYILSDVSISLKDYFASETWADVLKGGDVLIGGIGMTR